MRLVPIEVFNDNVSTGYLVQIGFENPMYLCSWGTISWNGITWAYADVWVSEVSMDSSGIQKCALTIGNNNNLMSSVILNEGINDKPIYVWIVYFDDNGDPVDPVPYFDGRGDGADFSTLTSVRIEAVSSSAKTLFSPRRRINTHGGFNYVPAPGTKITWGSITIELE